MSDFDIYGSRALVGVFVMDEERLEAVRQPDKLVRPVVERTLLDWYRIRIVRRRGDPVVRRGGSRRGSRGGRAADVGGHQRRTRTGPGGEGGGRGGQGKSGQTRGERGPSERGGGSSELGKLRSESGASKSAPGEKAGCEHRGLQGGSERRALDCPEKRAALKNDGDVTWFPSRRRCHIPEKAGTILSTRIFSEITNDERMTLGKDLGACAGVANTRLSRS